MENNSGELVKNNLMNCIDNICNSHHLFVKNPTKDFSRNRKLSFKKVLMSILSMGGSSLTNELIDFFNADVTTPSASAFVQQRSKISSTAFKCLFDNFAKTPSKAALYKKHRLFAVDGSDIHIPTNSYDKDSYYPGIDGQRSYNLLHLNALYDLCKHTYVDALIQKSHKADENYAFTTMADKYSDSTPAIFIADRGYESYNNMAHIQELGQFFLIRIKENHGIAKGLDLPDSDEFDMHIELSIHRKKTKQFKELCKADKNRYRIINASTRFDFVPQTAKEYTQAPSYLLKFRIVRVEISDNHYEMLVTNLDSDTFSAKELKSLYHMRWGIETSFRELKYTVGLLHFHSKKLELIIQEIYAKLTMYNYYALIVNSVTITQKNQKYIYKINFTSAVHVCKKYFLNNISPKKIEILLLKYISPVRPDRQYKRAATLRKTISFIYRIA